MLFKETELLTKGISSLGGAEMSFESENLPFLQSTCLQSANPNRSCFQFLFPLLINLQLMLVGEGRATDPLQQSPQPWLPIIIFRGG